MAAMTLSTKILEIRDSGTYIAALCVDMNSGGDPSVHYHLRRYGYPDDGEPNILVTRVDGNGPASNDPYSWGGRTWPVAHDYIIRHWPALETGDVVDVEFILGETAAPKDTERNWQP